MIRVGKGCCWWASALAAALLWAPAAGAQEPESGRPALGLELGFDYSSRYVFRGLDLLEGQPTPALRLEVSRGGLFAYYYSYRSRLGEGGPDYEEHDFGLEYTRTRGKLALTFGGFAYTYRRPRDYEDTVEVYGVAGLEVPLAPTLSIYYDTRAEGGYASLGVSRALPLVPDRLELGLSSTLGYDLGYYSVELDTGRSHGWNDLLLVADLAWNLTGHFAVHAAAQRSIALTVLDAVGQPDESIYTLGATFTF
jgi:hypothetical protein